LFANSWIEFKLNIFREILHELIDRINEFFKLKTTKKQYELDEKCDWSVTNEWSSKRYSSYCKFNLWRRRKRNNRKRKDYYFIFKVRAFFEHFVWPFHRISRDSLGTFSQHRHSPDSLHSVLQNKTKNNKIQQNIRKFYRPASKETTDNKIFSILCTGLHRSALVS